MIVPDSPDLRAYRRIVVAFSGGKDSLAALLHLLHLGVPADAIELHHHDVDGGGASFMDWPCTAGYVRAIAEHLGLRVYFSWREGGFARELERSGAPTAPVVFETPDGIGRAGGNGPIGTRGLFPQTSADLRVRWCSPSLKIDVLAAAIRNQDRFLDGATLVVTGERAAESPAARITWLLNRIARRAGDAQSIIGAPSTAGPRHGSGRQLRIVDPSAPCVHAWLGTSVVSNVHLRLARSMGDRASRLPRAFQRVKVREAASGKTIHRAADVETRADRGSPILPRSFIPTSFPRPRTSTGAFRS
ncbi:hypothetical protein GCM10020258_57230 [Sphingomonas yabuuchiae]